MVRPQGVETIPAPDHVGRSGREGQGPFFVVSLKLADGKISSTSFRSLDCPWSISIGSALAKLAEGKTPAEACRLTEADIEKELGGVPRAKRHYLPLAVSALRDALGHASPARPPKAENTVAS